MFVIFIRVFSNTIILISSVYSTLITVISLKLERNSHSCLKTENEIKCSMYYNLLDRTIFFLGGFETKMVGPFYMKNARTDGVWVWHNLLAVTSLNGIADPQRKRVIYTTVRVTKFQ